MTWLVWSRAAFQGKQDKCRWVGEVSPFPLGISWVSCLGPGRLGETTQLMYRVHPGQGRIAKNLGVIPYILISETLQLWL